MKVTDMKIDKEDNSWDYVRHEQGSKMNSSACPHLFIINLAWDNGCDYEDLADGYGEGAGTNGDWSGIRDSTHEAKEKMLERGVNWLIKRLNN